MKSLIKPAPVEVKIPESDENNSRLIREYILSEIPVN